MANTIKQYQVILPFNQESKTFSVGNGETLTIKNGTILDEDHLIVKKFKSQVTYIGEKLADSELLIEEPVAPAVVEDVKEVQIVEEKQEEIAEDTQEDVKEVQIVEEKQKSKPGPKAKA